MLPAEAGWLQTAAAIREGMRAGITSEEIAALVRDFVPGEMDDRTALARLPAPVRPWWIFWKPRTPSGASSLTTSSRKTLGMAVPMLLGGRPAL
jgi:hypothetical protein